MQSFIQSSKSTSVASCGLHKGLAIPSISLPLRLPVPSADLAHLPFAGGRESSDSLEQPLL